MAQKTFAELRDVAAEAGLVDPVIYGNLDTNAYILETTGTGAAILDYDGDGDRDVFIANGVRLDADAAARPSFLYRNDGAGRFEDVAAEAGLERTGWAQGACVGDVDNDGAPDLYVAYHGADAFYRNRGDGSFEEATAAAGLAAGEPGWSSGCAFLDYDRDGWLDLFVAEYVAMTLDEMPEPGSAPSCYWKTIPVFCGPRSLPKSQNRLYRNRGDGTFEDVTKPAGILTAEGRFALGVVAADFNNDGWTDLYVACDQTPSLLYENQGDGGFVERGVESGVAYNFDGALQAGMGVAVADYDGNGFLDILKTNFQGDLPSLYVNEDGQFYEDLAFEAGLGAHKLLGWGALWLDIDEDSRPDAVLANGHIYPEVEGAGLGEDYLQPTLVYRNLGDGRFEDATARAGPAFETPRPARGMAAGDLDGDGRPEIVIANVNQPPSLLRNAAERPNAFLWLELEGVESNRSAIGARVAVEAGGRTQVQDVTGGGSYYSQSDLALHFGLGSAGSVDALEVRWPSGSEQRFTELAPGRYRLIEGSEPYRAAQ